MPISPTTHECRPGSDAVRTRTFRYLSEGGLAWRDEDLSTPGPGEARVRTLWCGICKADVVAWSRGVSEQPPGHEGVGRVEAVGPGVTGVCAGDIVAGSTIGFATAQRVPVASLYPVPIGAGQLETADQRRWAAKRWLVEPAACVVTGLERCELRPGDRLALLGCGFMGLLMLQALAGAWWSELLVVDPVPARLDRARTIGGSAFAEPAAVGPNQWSRFDVVIDATGHRSGLKLAGELTRPGGLINLFGWNRGELAIDGTAWHLGGFTVVNTAPNAARFDPWPAAIRLLAEGRLRPESLVTHLGPPAELEAVLREAATGSDSYTKGVIVHG